MSEELAREGEKSFNGLNYISLLCQHERSLVFKEHKREFYSFTFFLFFLFPILPSRKKSIPFTMKPPFPPPSHTIPSQPIYLPSPSNLHPNPNILSSSNAASTNSPTTPKPPTHHTLLQSGPWAPVFMQPNEGSRRVPSRRSCLFCFGMSGS